MSSTSVFNLSVEIVDKIDEYADEECEEIMRCFQDRSRPSTPTPSPAIHLEPKVRASDIPAAEYMRRLRTILAEMRKLRGQHHELQVKQSRFECTSCEPPAKRIKMTGPRTSPESPESRPSSALRRELVGQVSPPPLTPEIPESPPPDQRGCPMVYDPNLFDLIQYQFQDQRVFSS